MPEPVTPKTLTPDEQAALYHCALQCWHQRAQLNLTPEQIEQTLVGFMAVGGAVEGEAAAELLGSIRRMKDKQLRFDSIIPALPTPPA